MPHTDITIRNPKSTPKLNGRDFFSRISPLRHGHDVVGPGERSLVNVGEKAAYSIIRLNNLFLPSACMDY
jgi:hypothetical protein